MTEHPAHFTERVPHPSGVPTAIEIFPDPKDRSQRLCRDKGGHWWHPMSLGLFYRRQCCQCGARGRGLWQGRP